MKKSLIHIPVPTSTIIPHHFDDPYKVYLIEQAVKHDGKQTLVGGRREFPGQSHAECAIDEWDQEAGGKGATLINLRFWLDKKDLSVDVRKGTLGQFAGKTCPKHLVNEPAIGLYGSPDAIYIAAVQGTPHPKDGEAKQCLLMDVRDLVITETAEQSKFGAQHDLLLGLYRYYLDKNQYVGSGTNLEDMSKLRTFLLEWQERGWK